MAKDMKGRELGKFISQRANGTYLAKYHNSEGKLCYISSKDLKNLRIELEKAITLDMQGEQGEKVCNINVNEFFKIWLDTYKVGLSSTTKTGYRIAFRHISDSFGDMDIKDIRALDFINLFADMEEMGYQSSTITQIKMIAGQMFGAALANGFISKNPILGMVIISKKEQKNKVLSPEELDSFFDYINNKKHPWVELFQLLILTGLRSGEIRSLTWDNIDFNNKQILIDRTVREIDKNGERNLIISNPKTKNSNRIIPINIPVEKVLISQRNRNENVDIDTYLKFGNLVFVKDGKIISQSSLCYTLRSIEKQMYEEGIAIGHLHPHMFRHMYTSKAISAGVNILALGKILGHKSIKTTLNCYDHPDELRLKAAMEKFRPVGVKMV